MITLYHGSNVTVDMPKILPKLRALDFGCGFYLTSSYAQAERWAKVIFKRRQAGQPIVNMWESEQVTGNPRNSLYLRADEV